MFEQKRCERVSVQIEGPSAHTLDHGIGVNWHHNWFPPSAPRDSAPPIDDMTKWNLLLEEMSFVRPACIRFGYEANRFVDEQTGEINWQAEGFEALRRIHDWAVKHDAVLIFDPWSIPRYYSFGQHDNGNYYDAPRDITKFVDGFVIPVLRHIKQVMMLSGVSHFILMNEPLTCGDTEGWSPYMTPPGIDKFIHYVELHQAVYTAIQQHGLGVKLIGPDTNSTLYWSIDWFHERNVDISPYLDAFDQHHYWGRFDYAPPNPHVAETETLDTMIKYHVAKNARYAKMKGKPYYITELGTFYYGWSRGDPYGPATHEAFVMEAEFMIRAMQVGCGGFYRWAFIAPGEYQDGVWAFINTVDDSYTRQPHTFYGYCGLMRYSSRGSKVWITKTEQRIDPYTYVHAVGLENSDGTHTVFIVNDHPSQERVVTVQLPETWGNARWQRFINDRTRKMYRNEVDATNGSMEAVLPPMSLTVFTDRRLPGDETFPINNNVHTLY